MIGRTTVLFCRAPMSTPSTPIPAPPAPRSSTPSRPTWAAARLGPLGLAELMRLRFSDSGALYSPHADVNINGALFGGQLIGQAIAAASHGIGDRWAHSVQVSFLARATPARRCTTRSAR
jgi:hypothetical protein